jgi:3-oxoacyl-[acyl-carrier-protein] synthase-1
MPGEAAACVLLESEPVARRRSARVEALLVAAASGQEPNHFFSGEVSMGVALGDAIAQVIPQGAPFTGDLFADLNGEPWRAYELGCARVRLSQFLSESVRMVLPAASLGETGAASGLVALCAAVRSFVRGYGHAGQALISSSSEHGHVGALHLARAAA